MAKFFRTLFMTCTVMVIVVSASAAMAASEPEGGLVFCDDEAYSVSDMLIFEEDGAISDFAEPGM